MIETKIKWHKLNSAAKIPSKRDEDAGFDIYTTEKEVTLMPGEIHMFETGLQSSFDKNIVGIVKERGSTGSIGLTVHSGIMDSGYRGEWKIVLQNFSNHKIVFTNDYLKVTKDEKINTIYYPLSKAICQVIFFELPNYKIEESAEDLSTTDKSERSAGGWGSSGK